MSEEPKMVACRGDCGKILPQTADYFNRNGEKGFHPYCRECRAEKRTEIRDKKREARSSKLQAEALDVLHTAMVHGSNIPHTQELVENLMVCFGGVGQFAKHAVAHYFDSEMGSASRTKLLQSVMQLIVKNTEQGGAGKPKDLMSDEELEQAFNDGVQQAVLRIALEEAEATDGEEEAA